VRVVDRTVLVTGGASGIGIAITRELARRGNRVVVAGRNEGALRAAATIANVVEAVRCDITSDHDVDALRARVTERFGALDILVNNAGTLENYDFVTAEDAMRRATNEVTTNVLGTLRITKAMLPLLKRSDAGAIVMNTSIVGVVPSSPIAVYGATKAALHSFSCSLRFELSKDRVRVFELMPPGVDTAGARHLNIKKIAPDAVAATLVRGMEADRYEIAVGPAAALAFVNRISPLQAEKSCVTRNRAYPTSVRRYDRFRSYGPLPWSACHWTTW